MAQTLELYYKDSCPWCHKVMDFMDANGIKVDMKNVITDPANKEHLIEVGGKSQVPCLFIDGKPLYESGDIINYLAQEFGVEAPQATGDEPASGACSLDGSGCH